MRRILLRLYPAAWRKEYGEEFADVLAARPLGMRVVFDVVWGAAWQRVRYAPQWMVVSGILFVLSSVHWLLQAFGWISPEIVEVTGGPIWQGLLVTAGLWLAGRKNGSFGSGVTGTMAAAAIGILPFLLMLPFGHGARFTFTIGDDYMVPVHSTAAGVALFLVFNLAIGAVFGAFGAAIGTAIRRGVRRRRA